MQSKVETYTERLSDEKESFQGQICQCMPGCSDHSLLQLASMVPLCNWVQLAIKETQFCQQTQTDNKIYSPDLRE